MKKIVLSISLLAATFVNAQENWVATEYSGFVQGAAFRVNQVFQNRIYVAGDTTSGPNTGSVLYSSASGDMGSFTPELGLKPVLQAGFLTSSASNSSKLFFATEVKYDTTGGVTGNTPQVYRFDGTTYTQHGTIDYSMLPPDNQMVSGNNPSIAVMALYSPTGSNDTVYAFEKTHYGAIKNVSVFKAPANVTNPTWINVTNFPTSSGITDVYDAAVWHKKLYVAVNSNSNGGMILRTANGADWDTVAKASNMFTVLGVNSFNDYFKTLEVFRDTLVAGVINSFNTALVYTADSLAFTQTWSAFIDSSAGAQTLTNTVSNIVDMTVGDGKLWILGTGNMANGPRGFVVTKNAHNKDTLLTSTSGTGLEAGNNLADDYKMSYFNNAVYAVGHIYGGARIGNPNARASGGGAGAGTPMNAGNIWRFKTVKPVASFLDTVNTGYGYCYGNYIYLACTSADASDAAWYTGGSQFANGLNPYFSPNGPGTYLVTMVAYNGNSQSLYWDTISKIITVYANPIIDTAFAATYTVCQGQPDNLTVHVSGGTMPYTYSWDNYTESLHYPGDSITQIQLYVVPQGSPYVIVGPNVKDANLCTAYYSSLYIYVNPSDSLSGLVLDTLLNPVTAGKVYLYKKQVNNMGIQDTLFDLSLSGNGTFTFPSLYYGDYWVKAVADTSNPLYKTSVPTYYSNRPYGHAYQWDSALVVLQHGCTGGNNTGNNINIIQIPSMPATGLGTISGHLSESISFGARYSSGHNSPLGAPLKGVDIKLGKNPGGSPAARTQSDSSGNYTFNHVQPGNYKIYVDIPNYGMDSVRLVSIDSLVPTTSVHNDYYVDSTMIRVVPVDSVTASICTGDSIMLGGAYQHNAGIYTDILQTAWQYDSVVVTTLTIKALPTLTVVANNYTVCSGSPVILTATGATSFQWDSNAGSATTSTVSVHPTSATIYTVTGTANACSSKQTISIATLALPIVVAHTSLDSVCTGGNVTLTGSGALTYTWSGGAVNATPFSPGTTANYTVMGTDANNCVNSDTVTVVVKSCIGIKTNSAVGLLNVYPMPAANTLYVETEKNARVRIYDVTGQMVLEQSVTVGKNELNISALSSGAYNLAIQADGKVTNVKVMISK